MRFWAIFGLLLFTGYSYASQITGTAPSYKHQVITAAKLRNSFAHEWQEISRAFVDSNGHFELPVSDEIRYIQIQVGLKTTTLELAPNCHIQLAIIPFAGEENLTFPLKTRKEYLRYPPQFATDTTYWEIEHQLALVQEDLKHHPSPLLAYQHVKDSLQHAYASYTKNDAFFRDNFHYLLANSELLFTSNVTKLTTQYLANQPVRYTIPMYAKFSSQALPQYVHSLFSQQKTALTAAKKAYQIAAELQQIIADDRVLNQPELQDLALTLYLTSPSSNNLLTTEEIAAARTQLQLRTTYGNIAAILENFQRQKSQLLPGTEAPAFCLMDVNADSLCLTNFKKQWVYLGFINLKSRSCQKDLLVISKFAKSYKRITFVLVITDSDLTTLPDNFPTASNVYSLLLQDQHEVLSSYQVGAYPMYYLIDKYGYLKSSPAERPSEMGRTFEQLTAKKNGRKPYEE